MPSQFSFKELRRVSKTTRFEQRQSQVEIQLRDYWIQSLGFSIECDCLGIMLLPRLQKSEMRVSLPIARLGLDDNLPCGLCFGIFGLRLQRQSLLDFGRRRCGCLPLAAVLLGQAQLRSQKRSRGAGHCDVLQFHPPLKVFSEGSGNRLWLATKGYSRQDESHKGSYLAASAYFEWCSKEKGRRRNKSSSAPVLR